MTVTISFSLSDFEYNRLKQIAERLGVSVLELVRSKCGCRTDANAQNLLAAKQQARVCEICGTTQKLDIHHIDGSGTQTQPNNDPSNLITLCHKCHMRKHTGFPIRVKEVMGRRGNGETFQSIADSFGVTRQRIHQIVKQANCD